MTPKSNIHNGVVSYTYKILEAPPPQAEGEKLTFKEKEQSVKKKQGER